MLVPKLCAHKSQCAHCALCARCARNSQTRAIPRFARF